MAQYTQAAPSVRDLKAHQAPKATEGRPAVKDLAVSHQADGQGTPAGAPALPVAGEGAGAPSANEGNPT